MAINYRLYIGTLQRSLSHLAPLLVTLLLQVTVSFARTRLPAVFGNGMVLQQSSTVPVWGWADPGESICVRGSWDNKEAVVTANTKGEWRAALITPEAGGPFTLTITASNQIVVKDVLIGEVWLCSGQSNMVFALKSSAGSKEEIPKANLPRIRYFSVKRQYGPNPYEDCEGSEWKASTPETAGSFSAVAYYFAKNIQEKLGVPVGIIYAAWGGTPAEAWTPPAALQSNSVLRQYFDRWQKILSNVGEDSVKYHAEMAKWKGDSTGKKPSEPQTLYYFNRPWREPGVLYNGMIHPVIPFAIKGVLWYQGESNVGYADEYTQLFTSMINAWRSQWKQEETLPFHFVQIAPFGYNDLDAAARLREAQYHVANNVNATGMAVTMDLGNMKDIHFTRKKEIGDRLAFIALAKNYGLTRLEFRGPEIKSVKSGRGKLVLHFDARLQTTGENVAGLELGISQKPGNEILYKSVRGKVKGKKIIITHDRNWQPVELRYGWLLAGEANLLGKNGLPASPFRTRIKGLKD